MRTLMESAMADGACGLSTGLIYAPGSYSETEEIVEIARGAAGGGFYASHIRGEGATLLDSVAEAIRVGREGGLPTQVSHIKAAGRLHWGKVKDALGLIDAARADGLDVMADVYPYTASSTTIRTLLPDSALEGGIEAMLDRLKRSGRARADPRRDGERRRARPRDGLERHHDRLRALEARRRRGSVWTRLPGAGARIRSNASSTSSRRRRDADTSFSSSWTRRISGGPSFTRR